MTHDGFKVKQTEGSKEFESLELDPMTDEEKQKPTRLQPSRQSRTNTKT